jgi:colanic acid/amylovoran biosynthesis glycosyltransferase
VTESNIAYILSIFPGYTETFVSSEVREVQRLLGSVHVFSLKNLPADFIVHADCMALKEQTHYSPYFLSAGLVGSQLHFLRRRPITYVRCLFDVTRGNISRPMTLVKTLLVFPKIVYFARIMESLGIKHVHAHWANYPTTAALTTSRLLGIPYSFTCHAHDIFVNCTMLEEKVRTAKFVVTISDYNRRFIKNKSPAIDEKKIHVIHCGVDTGQILISNSNGSGRFTLVSVARLTKKKGLEYLIKACRILSEKGIDYRCTIVGEGSEGRRLSYLVEESKLSQRVDLVGAVAHEKVLRLLGEAHVFVLPCILSSSDADGIPVSLMEAMAAGLPVVSTSISGIPELVEDGVSGFLVQPSDESALASAIEKLAQDRTVRAEMGQKGRQKVEREFDIRNSARLMVGLFQNCCTESNAERPGFKGARVAH